MVKKFDELKAEGNRFLEEKKYEEAIA